MSILSVFCSRAVSANRFQVLVWASIAADYIIHVAPRTHQTISFNAILLELC